MPAVAEAIVKRAEGLKSGVERKQFEDHAQQIAELVMPRKDAFYNENTPGEKKMQRVYDPTGIHSNEMLAAGLHGMATNPATRWFGIRLLDEELMERDDVKEWLSSIERIMFREMHAPGPKLTTHLHELYLDLGAFGTGVMFIGKSANDQLLFQTRHLGECFIDENAEGRVDTVYRCFEMNVRQLWQMSEDKDWSLSSKTAKMAEKQEWNQKVKVIHAVYPRAEREKGKETADNMPYASIYLEEAEQHILLESGFEEFPYAVPRWYKQAGERYGRSPGMTALPDVKMLQEMMKTTLKAAQKIVDPPLQVPDDGVVGPVRTIPGGLNFLRPGSEIRPLITGGQIGLSEEMMEQVRNRIRTTFFVDIVQVAPPDVNITATEFMQRTQDRMRLLGPIIGRMEAELLGPMINRNFGVLSRIEGKLPEAPDGVEDQEFTVEYVSPIASAQRAAEVDGFMQYMQEMALIAQANPQEASNISARIEWTKIPEWVADRRRIDPELILSDEEVEAKQQQNAMQNAVSAAPDLAKATKDFADAGKSVAEAQAIQ